MCGLPKDSQEKSVEHLKLYWQVQQRSDFSRMTDPQGQCCSGHSPSVFVSSRHKRRSIPSTFLSATHSAADKQQALLFQTLTPALGKWKRKNTLPCEISAAATNRAGHSVSPRPTVVSLYSELPPSMMMSPASRRGT